MPKRTRQLILPGQMSLGDSEEYVHDIITVGNRIPYLRHADHSVAGMRKPFVSWDGEGYTDEFGQHHYWLLANNLGDRIVAPPGRSIERWNIARTLHSVHSRIPSAIHVGFALGYDFTMLLRSNGLENSQRESLAKKQYLEAEGFVWKLMMGKQLTLWPSDNAGGKFILQDTWGFFQRSFIKALDEYFDGDWPYRDVIVEMKAKRATFDREHDEEVISYNDMELELLVMLMEELRDRLFQAGMPVARWYGPGAIANGLLQRWGAKRKMVNLYDNEPNVAAAAQYAYAGGRFELLKPGHANTPVYQYDINSAYPAALANVPDLADGEWRHINDPSLDALPEFSMVRLRWSTTILSSDYTIGDETMAEIYPLSIPFPFWRRTPQGNITYPATGIHGWYWLPEAKAGIAYGESLPAGFGVDYTIEEAYAYYPNSDARPYDQIPTLYRTRQVLKARGNGAHIGIKLGLNSLYGKFAQQVGYSEDNKRIPPYHNLAIAGYVTAVCRAGMIEAAMQNPSSIIAFETDGVFSIAPLPGLEVNTELGGWDLTTYDDMWYYQSGFRFGILDGEIVKPATRGVPVKDVSLELMQKEIVDCLSTVTVMQTQFYTLQWAHSLRHPEYAGQWKTAPREMRLMCESLNGKRIHDPDCYMCDLGPEGIRVYRNDMPHVTVPAMGWEGQMNAPHKILWSELGGVGLSKEERVFDLDQDTIIEP